MNIILPIFFASIAAIGNALFALGQKKSAGFENGLLIVGASALVAFLCAIVFSPLIGEFNVEAMVKFHWKSVLLSGVGLFLTYLGFNLLYSKFSVSHYVLYAVISIITTTVFVGMFWLKEPINRYHIIAIGLAVVAVAFFSLGQSKL